MFSSFQFIFAKLNYLTCKPQVTCYKPKKSQV